MKLRILALLLPLILFAGCTPSGVPTDYRWASVEGGQLDKDRPGEEFYFQVPMDESKPDSDPTPVSIQVSGKVESGHLRFELRNPDGQPVWNSGTIGTGDFSISSRYGSRTQKPGTYTLGYVWETNTRASYNLSWHALMLTPAVFVPGTGMILIALAFIAFSRRRETGWRYLLLGALFWMLTVAVKFAVAVPLNPLVYKALKVSDQALFSSGNLAVYLYIGALTGIFEAGLAWAILRRSRWGKATWNQALAFGIGFGAVEALLLGLLSLGSAGVGYFTPTALPVPTLASLARNNDLLMALAPLVERLTVILAHIFACVLIFYAIQSGEKKWAWLAILYKTILDTPGGFAAFWVVTTPARLWSVEAVIALIALFGLWGTVIIRRRYEEIV